MATVFQGTSAIQINVNSGDDLVVLPDAVISVANQNAVQMGAPGTTTVTNFGSILSGEDGIEVNAVVSNITNAGVIHSTSINAIEYNPEVLSMGFHQVTNTGDLIAANDVIGFTSGNYSLNLTLRNDGRMISTGSGSILEPTLNIGALTLVNTGLMQAAHLYLVSSSDSRFTNSGLVEVDFINATSQFGVFINNTGTIADTSADRTDDLIVTSSENDIIVNGGTILGRIDMQGGNDRFETLGDGSTSSTIDGGDGMDTIAGGSDADQIVGGSGSDFLVGRGGDDYLSGGSFNDTLLGGDGNDDLSGGSENDLLKGDAGNDTLEGGEENDTLFGGDGDDFLDGEEDFDLLLGGAGDDTLIGNDENDTLNGGAGNDSLDGGSENDILVGQDGSDTLLGGSGNDTMDGGAGDDILEGGDDNDILRGRAGEDEVAGGLGFDLLTGGADADQFVFRALAETAVGALRDQILDFEQGVDSIVVAGLSPGVFQFLGTSAFTASTSPELRLLETATGSTIVQFDADGNGTVDAEIRVAGVTGLTADDFVL